MGVTAAELLWRKIKAERKPRIISKHIKQSTLFTVAPTLDIIFEYVKVFCIFHWIWQKVPKLRTIISKGTLPIWESVKFGLLKTTRISHVVFCGWNRESWWRHQMETFSVLLAICVGNSLVTGEFSAQRPVTRSFDVFFDLRLNKQLRKQSWGWRFETTSRPLWHDSNSYLVSPS